MRKALALLVMTLSFCLTSCSSEKAEIPAVKVTSLGKPCRTSRLWVYELSENLKGETVFVGEFMNYKNTTGRKTTRHQLPGGRHYVAYTDTDSRPDSEWLILNLTTGRSKVIKLPLLANGLTAVVTSSHRPKHNRIDAVFYMASSTVTKHNVQSGFMGTTKRPI